VSRLFFALWPDVAAAEALAELARVLAEPLDARPTPREKIHLTLAFLGEVADDALERAIQAGDAIQADSFDMVLDHVGSFRKSKVGWAGSDRPAGGLVSLNQALVAALDRFSLPFEQREFTPHVTLARKIARPLPRTPLPQAISWRADGFSLVKSAGGRYENVASWDLR
jgi:RNA 2',3'-cyclic 3'-phosphodiesterase